MLPRIDPLPLTKIAEPVDDPDFVYELKHDGFRAVAYLERGKPARLVSRRGIDYRSFGPLAAALGETFADITAVLDGELVCLDGDGRSQFVPLLRRREQPSYYAFDLLWLNGRDLRDAPLIERRAVLRSLIPQRSAHVIAADYLHGRGSDLYRAECKRDCEGIVAKLPSSSYRLLPGRKSPWVKVLNPRYTQKEGRFDYLTRRR